MSHQRRGQRVGLLIQRSWVRSPDGMYINAFSYLISILLCKNNTNTTVGLTNTKGIQLSGRASGCNPAGPWFNSECPLLFCTYSLSRSTHQKAWAKRGFEPRTSCTQSRNHTPRPLSHLLNAKLKLSQMQLSDDKKVKNAATKTALIMHAHTHDI